jgi:hypothetical protein
MMANREDGSFSGGAMSFVKRATAFGLNVSGKAFSLASPDPYFDAKISDEFGAIADLIEANNLTGKMYVEGQVNRAIFNVIDTGILEHNMQKFGNPELEGKLMKLAPAEDKLYDMLANGDVKLSDTMDKDGISFQTLEVKVDIKSLPEGITQTLFTGGKTEDSQWMPLVNADGDPYPISSKVLDISAKQYGEDLHRIKMKRITDAVKGVGVFFGEGALRVSKPRGKMELNARGKALRQFFSDLF